MRFCPSPCYRGTEEHPRAGPNKCRTNGGSHHEIGYSGRFDSGGSSTRHIHQAQPRVDGKRTPPPPPRAPALLSNREARRVFLPRSRAGPLGRWIRAKERPLNRIRWAGAALQSGSVDVKRERGVPYGAPRERNESCPTIFGYWCFRTKVSTKISDSLLCLWRALCARVRVPSCLTARASRTGVHDEPHLGTPPRQS